MADTGRHAIPGSERSPATGHTRVGDVDPEQQVTVTVYLRRPPGEATARLSREDFAARRGTDPADVQIVERFAASHGLSVRAADPARSCVSLAGRLGDLQEALGASLGVYSDPAGSTYRGRTGALSVPPELVGVVTAVFGLDERPPATPRLRRAAAAAVQYTPVQVAAAYSFPPRTDGSGQCVGLVELGGGFRQADLDTYFSSLGLPSPSVVAVSVDGGSSNPAGASGPDAEVMLDIEIVGAAAPGAAVAVYFAPNTEQGFVDAVSTAVHDPTNRPSVISISWGGPESTWSGQAMRQVESSFADGATMGVAVTAAVGDSGSTDGVADGRQHVDFPASAPHALACGGTRLIGASETVWNDLSTGGGATGGGISEQFPLPAYQQGAGVPASANAGATAGRGVPDVAGDADPATGYAIRVDGEDIVVGGTSAVAPLWAALLARCNQALGSAAGFVHPLLYSAPGAFRDITSGDNGSYAAGAGWDACTGLGTPHGVLVLQALQAGAARDEGPPR